MTDKTCIIIEINQSTYDLLKAMCPFVGVDNATPELIAAAYIEENTQAIVSKLTASTSLAQQ